jgi:hypothetical protein
MKSMVRFLIAVTYLVSASNKYPCEHLSWEGGQIRTVTGCLGDLFSRSTGIIAFFPDIGSFARLIIRGGYI